jgi:hypothetical protein
MPAPAPVNLRGLALLDHVLDHIDAHPESWDQDTYGTCTTDPEQTPTSCNTAACIAGWTVVLASPLPLYFDERDGYLRIDNRGNYYIGVPEEAAELLDLPQNRAYYRDYDEAGLFHTSNTREDLQYLRDEIAAGTY